MNFVPKKPAEIALAEALAAVAQPAWVVDASRGLVVRANGRGNAVWGVPVMMLALDSAIPALRSLRARLIARPTIAGVASPDTAAEVLAFKTGMGMRAVPCTVRLLDETVGRGMMLVIADEASGTDACIEGHDSRTIQRRSDGTAAENAPSPLSAWQHVLGRSSAHAGGTGGMPLSDAETLREIARRIKQGSAGVSNANDAPDGEPDLVADTTARRAPSDREATVHAETPAFDWPEHLAHEIRTPLAAIVSLAEVITEERLGAWPNERYRGYVRDILDSARHGLDVVDGILRGLPERPGAVTAVADIDLNAEVEAICTSLQPLADKSGARLEAALVGGLPHIAADRRNIRQMLLNLITNSIKHGGGPVRIKVTTGYELAGEVWVEVEDNGQGFDVAACDAPAPGKTKRMGDQPRKAGLGLPLTRSLATANGARLDMASRPGGGVRARIVFGRERAVPRGD